MSFSKSQRKLSDIYIGKHFFSLTTNQDLGLKIPSHRFQHFIKLIYFLNKLKIKMSLQMPKQFNNFPFSLQKGWHMGDMVTVWQYPLLFYLLVKPISIQNMLKFHRICRQKKFIVHLMFIELTNTNTVDKRKLASTILI